ncbi:MAG: GNAT family N-acetyltransferase [Solirubrobacteraceae bacterium]
MRRPALLRRSGLPRPAVLPGDAAPAAPPEDHRIGLRVLQRSDREEFLRLATESRELHRPWTYPPERPDQFEELYARSRRDDCVCLLACLREDGAIAGVLIVSQIVRGAFQSAYLGYYAHQRHAGLGYMREAMAQTVDHAFGPLSLHRLEANIQPANRASIALAQSAGFRLEGFSPRYLLIGGQWRDHERYAITADDSGINGELTTGP